MPQQANPGSAIGEAVGAEIEAALNHFLEQLAESTGHHFVCTGPRDTKTGKPRKLLMYDKFGTAYNIDSVIANESMQPVILIESKYIRYKKHNRDKGSWLCRLIPRCGAATGASEAPLPCCPAVGALRPLPC